MRVSKWWQMTIPLRARTINTTVFLFYMNTFYTSLFITSPVNNFKHTCRNGYCMDSLCFSQTVVMSGCECLWRKSFKLAICGQAIRWAENISLGISHLLFSPNSLKHTAFLVWCIQGTPSGVWGQVLECWVSVPGLSRMTQCKVILRTTQSRVNPISLSYPFPLV